ncbi:MAG: Sodium/proton-dependent alanine carrier protein [Chlamydiales bacterium]|nr:Sodium/proton-dependent alanine carrier protein [Chlamydiales bacterium]MCH9619806.1 Sodium/proton-dependent alanine carrier protein [Chlamydiales bacterium]MCH9623412.1 Sodium/proton-dependent alanine carrier protein [Chlamydiales bacterium]
MFIEFLTRYNQLFTFYLIFPAMLLLGIYLSVRLRFLQFGKLKMGFAQLFKKEEGGEGNLSHYQAVSSVLAGNFGTGNISGMAIALTAGGPGALVWMWIMAFFGSIIQYSSCLLAVKYRRKNHKGEYVGGPMYYLSHLGYKKLAILFSILVLFGALGVGIFAQVNSMTLSLSRVGISPWVTAIIIALVVGGVTLGGIKRVAKVSSTIIPLMALLYLGSALVILSIHSASLLPAFKLMFASAFGKGAIVGGTLGYTMMKMVSTGLGRALFATDVGTGYVPILQAGAKTRHPVIDGVVALVAPFLVMIVCTITALVLIVTGAYTQPGLQSTNMIVHAFQEGVGQIYGIFVVNVALLLFGYTTILAWGLCFERAIGYLFSDRYRLPFRLLFILLIPIGALLRVDFVWAFADCTLSMMAFCNLVGVFGLTKEVVADSREFFVLSKI